ncbi:ABC transporter substrate-binding protein [Kitasatospora sp. NPDC058965]|uniref:ABC transporter substrate-binding protein n=1 Tax=Kitasatospora sp. NPDC058965 TaxID=3346682 RepID=UPI00369F3718
MSHRDRRGFLRLAAAVPAAAALTGPLAACTAPAAPSALPSGANRIDAGLSYGLSSGFDPMNASGVTPVAANAHVFEALVDLDPADRTPYHALARAMPTRVDALTYRVSLRAGATFHDGSPVTADDVVHSFTRVLDPAAGALTAQFLPFLDRVRALDAYTVEFRLGYPFDDLFAARLSVVKIVPSRLVQADPKGFDAAPVGSGPFRLLPRSADDRLEFRRWDAYNGPRPAGVADLTWWLLPDGEARQQALRTGRVLAVDDVPYPSVAHLAQLSELRAVESFGHLFLMFNCARKPFDDKRVRQALHHALDTDRIIAAAMFGNGSPVTGFLPVSHPAYYQAATAYPHDPARARALLAAAGATDLSLTLTSTDTGWVTAVAPLLQQAWEAVGVRTAVDVGPSADQYRKVDAGDFQVMAAPGDPSVFGSDLDLLLRWFYVGAWPTRRFRWAGSDPDTRLRGLLDRAARASDNAARHQLWHQALDLIADEVPLYPVVHRKLATAWDGHHLLNFRPLPVSGLSFLGVDVF